MLVHAGIVVTAEELAKARPREGAGRSRAGAGGFDVVELPAVEQAATMVHRGPMSRILPTAQHLAHWIDADGHRSAGYARELYLQCLGDQEHRVTEIQEPVSGPGGG
ncbi:GyrI-like domain-containing protein [Streptomyces pinistramenti]|uniref:GyrI-like domain-containing protein n=1 Tax=Streptomyces pinistramenti TaxID=2884812 RepID=UPI0027E4A369|nr:GyrI-like domain-containing protein [Streptomyces pinistramenti]